MKKLLYLFMFLLVIGCQATSSGTNDELLTFGEEIARGNLEELSVLAIPTSYSAYAFIPVEGQVILMGYSALAISQISIDTLNSAPDDFYFSRDPITGMMNVIPMVGEIQLNKLILNGDGNVPVGKANVPKELTPEDAEEVMQNGLGESAEKLWGERVGEELTEDHVIETENGERVVITQHSINHALEQNGSLALRCFANKTIKNSFVNITDMVARNDRSELFHSLKTFAGTILNGNKQIDFCGEGDWLYARISTCEVVNGIKVKVVKTIIRFGNNSKGRAGLMRFVSNETKSIETNICN